MIEPTVTIICAVLGCTAFWQLIDHIVEARRKKKFDIDQAVQDIQKDLVTLQNNQDNMKVQISELSESVAEDQAITARVRILSFADDMMSSREHSKDAFDQVLTDIDRYNRYCADHPHFKNNQTAMSVEMILDQYKECERKGTFLQYRRREE